MERVSNQEQKIFYWKNKSGAKQERKGKQKKTKTNPLME